jgi:hypothetical protein
MSGEDDLARWHRELHAILNAVADAMRLLGIARAGVAIIDSVENAADSRVEDLLENIATRVRAANALAERLQSADRSLAEVVQPLLGVPGDPPEIDLRPWWSRLLQRVSATARRTDAGERLETLRLEADAALLRATSRLARRA